MKVPASWSIPSTKKPSAWISQSKAPRGWSGSSVIHPKAQASNWNKQQKAADAWDSGTYSYDSFLPYDSVITYDGFPKPITTKAPRNWSST